MTQGRVHPATPAQRVAALRHLAAGRSLEETGKILSLSPAALRQALDQAADSVMAANDRAAAPRRHPHEAAIAATQRGQRPTSTPTAPTFVHDPTSPADRLRAAKALATENAASPELRTRQAGEKLTRAIAQLEAAWKSVRIAEAARARRQAAARVRRSTSRLTRHPGAFPCPHPGCERVGDRAFDTIQGRNLHQLRAGHPTPTTEDVPQ